VNRFELPGMIFALLVVCAIAVIGKGFWMVSLW